MKTEQNLADSTLTPAQCAVIESLLAGSSVTSAMAAAGLSRSLFYHWMKTDSVFVASLNQARLERLESVRASLAALATQATETIRELLTDSEAPAATRAKTALVVLQAIGALEPTPPGPTDVEMISVSQMLANL